MYKEVAFDPKCMAEFEFYNLIHQHFGFDHGRYIAADIKEWAKEAMQIVKASNMQTIKQHSVKNYLNRIGRLSDLSEFHLAEDRKNITGDSWENWWDRQTSIRNFSTTISETKKHALRMEDINGKHPDWVIPRSIEVSKEAAYIMNALVPLLRLSEEITLIDPYFSFNQNPVLMELFNQSHCYSINSITIVSIIQPKDPQLIYSQQYEHLNTKGINFKWIVAPDKFFHDRYFISNIGAIRSGQGFSEDIEKGTHADTYKFNIIGKDEANGVIASLKDLLTRCLAKTTFESSLSNY